LLVESKLNLGLRYFHTATFIDDKLYILGGAIPGFGVSQKESFLYIDFSVPFNTNELRWNDLSATTNNIVPHQSAAARVDEVIN
jgi:hypothetical protein